MKYLFLSALILSTLQANADATASVVKVYSGTCARATQIYRGSGVLVSHSGKSYVVTSNHVIQSRLPSNCHEIFSEKFGKLKAKHLATDWGVGLSVLSTDESHETAINPDAFNFTLQADEPVTTAGFPYESVTQVKNSSGKVLAPESKRHLFPTTKSLIEVVGAHGEYGMSGGAAFTGSGDTLKFAGILSHQALVMEGGKATQVKDISSGGVLQNHVLVIPAKVVAEFIASAAEQGQQYVSGFTAIDSKRVITSGFEFKLLSPAESKNLKIGGGGDPVGIGGGKGDPVGIGGKGDPVGIGGDKGDPVGIGGSKGDPVGIGGIGDDDISSTELSAIVIKKSAMESSAFSPELTNKSWWPDLSKVLLRSGKAYVKTLVRKQKNSGITEYKILYIASLEQFFHRVLESDEVIPLIYDPSEIELGAKEKKIREQAMRVIEAAKKLGAGLEVSKSVQDQLFRINLVAGILASNNWRIVQSTEVRELVDAEAVQPVWDEMFQMSFQPTVDLMSSLRRLTEIL